MQLLIFFNWFKIGEIQQVLINFNEKINSYDDEIEIIKASKSFKFHETKILHLICN